MKIAWGITGAGSYLRKTLEIAKKLSNNKNKKITFFVSEAGEEVLKRYGLFEKLDKLTSNKYLEEKILETEKSLPDQKIGRFMLGKYDALILSPTTSNSVAKMAHGISDSLITNIFTSATKSRTKTIILPVDYEEDTSITPLIIDKEKCQKCNNCPPRQKCPNNAINNHQIINSKCNGCEICIKLCKHDAIEKKKINIKPRELDIENIHGLKEIENVKLIKKPEMVFKHL